MTPRASPRLLLAAAAAAAVILRDTAAHRATTGQDTMVADGEEASEGGVLSDHGSSGCTTMSNRSDAEVDHTSFPNTLPWSELHQSTRKVLGEGSFGIVARYGTRCSSSDTVVVKEVKQDLYAPSYERQEQCKEALNEADVSMQLAQMGHAVRILDVHPKDCDYNTLRHYPRMNIMMARAWTDATPSDSKRAAYSLLLDITQQLFSGLEALHNLGYLHRDIKPANLLVESRAKVFEWEDCKVGACRFTLADFGLACKRGTAGSPSTTCTSMAGTPFYMAPELAHSIHYGTPIVEKFGRGSDYWALGLTLYNMATHHLPGQLDFGFSHRNDLWRYLAGLSSSDWWMYDATARGLREDAGSRDGSSNYAKVFFDILSLLLIPQRRSRTDSVIQSLNGLLAQVPQQKAVSIPQVCVDPCQKCGAGQCRAKDLEWKCTRPPVEPIRVSVAILDSKPLMSAYLKMDLDSQASELADLKQVAQKYFQMELGMASWNFAGQDTQLYEWTTIQNGAVLEMSPPLRQALLTGRSIGEAVKDAERDVKANPYTDFTGIAWGVQTEMYLKDANLPQVTGRGHNSNGHFEFTGKLVNGRYDLVATNQHGTWPFVLGWDPNEPDTLVGSGSNLPFKMKRKVMFPYLPAAKNLASKILEVNPSKDWSDFMRSVDSVQQATVAHTLRPLVQEVQNHMAVNLDYWWGLVDGLSLPHDRWLAQEREKNIANAAQRCHQAGWSHCATNVFMDMFPPVDYVIVEFPHGESMTKLKFFSNGKTLLTRGDGVSKGQTREVLPILPGGQPLTITICKNLKEQTGFHPLDFVGNLFVKSDSRCSKIGESFSYTLNANGVTGDTQTEPTARKGMKFQISEDPQVLFSIWDGDYVLP